MTGYNAVLHSKSSGQVMLLSLASKFKELCELLLLRISIYRRWYQFPNDLISLSSWKSHPVPQVLLSIYASMALIVIEISGAQPVKLLAACVLTPGVFFFAEGLSIRSGAVWDVQRDLVHGAFKTE